VFPGLGKYRKVTNEAVKREKKLFGAFVTKPFLVYARVFIIAGSSAK
jgi:hypothetical protein